MSATARLHAVSEVEVVQYRQFGLPDEKIHLVYNGLDLAAFEKLPEPGAYRRQHNLPPDAKLLLHLGRIHKKEEIDFIVRTFAQLVNEDKQAVLFAIGPDDGEQGALESLVHKSMSHLPWNTALPWMPPVPVISDHR